MRVCENLRPPRLRQDLWGRWFAELTATFVDGVLVITAPSAFHAAFVRDNYLEFLVDEARAALGERLHEIKIVAAAEAAEGGA